MFLLHPTEEIMGPGTQNDCGLLNLINTLKQESRNAYSWIRVKTFLNPLKNYFNLFDELHWLIQILDQKLKTNLHGQAFI